MNFWAKKEMIFEKFNLDDLKFSRQKSWFYVGTESTKIENVEFWQFLARKFKCIAITINSFIFGTKIQTHNFGIEF